MMTGDLDDYHPPTDVRAAEALLAKLYNAVRTSPAWEDTALVIAATALVAAADRSEIDLLSRNRLLRDWQRRWRQARAAWDRGLVRLATVARSLTNQLLLRQRRKA